MLRITGSNKAELKKSIKAFLNELKINSEALKKDEKGFFINGDRTLYRGTPDFENGVLRLVETDQQPALLLVQIKEGNPEIDIMGSLEFGDDNYRKMFFFKSESGSNDITVEYALGSTDLHDAIGYPASESAYLYTSHSMYGEEIFGIQTLEDFRCAGSVVKAFLRYIHNAPGKNLARLWDEFTDQDLDFDGSWTDLYKADGSFFKMSQSFLSDFIEKYNATFPEDVIDQNENDASVQKSSGDEDSNEYDIMEMLEAEMSPEEISEVTGISIEKVYEFLNEVE